MARPYNALAADEPDPDAPPPAATPVRPAAYYGDGPFDAPSSDEEDELLSKLALPAGPGSPGLAERGVPLSLQPARARSWRNVRAPRRTRMRLVLRAMSCSRRRCGSCWARSSRSS
jgi:hypothetical protein